MRGHRQAKYPQRWRRARRTARELQTLIVWAPPSWPLARTRSNFEPPEESAILPWPHGAQLWRGLNILGDVRQRRADRRRRLRCPIFRQRQPLRRKTANLRERRYPGSTNIKAKKPDKTHMHRARRGGGGGWCLWARFRTRGPGERRGGEFMVKSGSAAAVKGTRRRATVWFSRHPPGSKIIDEHCAET